VGAFDRASALLQMAVEGLSQDDPLTAAEAANDLGMALLELQYPNQASAVFQDELRLLGSGTTERNRRVVALVNLSNAALQANDVRGARNAWHSARAEAGNDTGLRPIIQLAEAQILLREDRLRDAEELLETIAN